MAITKVQKQWLVKQYAQDLQECKSLIVFKQSGLAVSTDANIRREVREEDWKYNVVRKRLFIRALTEAGYPEVNLENIPWSAVAVYAKWDEYAPLKVINKYLKEFNKDKDLDTKFEFLWGWFDKEWKDADYITEMANIPSKDELLSKLVWLFNYPVQSLTSVLDQIAKKKEEGGDVVAKEEPKDEEATEEKVEEKKDEVTEEPKADKAAE